MKHVQIDKEKMIFVEGGNPFFYLADTAWMAFSNMSIEEWEEYTDFRKNQGFTAMQISILPILNDTSFGENTVLPFAMGADGKMDFSRRNEAYFAKAEQMTEVLVNKGLVPALVVLWNNYVPTAWAAEKIGNISLMSESYLGEYAAYVTEKFSRFKPVYIISGDTSFDTETVTRYYSIMLEEVKKRSPEIITTMHLNPSAEVPPLIRDSLSLDFYMFQSGHGGESFDDPFKLAEKFRRYKIRRPVVNGEPCYEGHAYGNHYPRFSAFEVRRAVWQSLLSGAKAGVTYGAHGIWMFQHKGMTFTSEGFSSFPFQWRDALRFEGAWDVSYARWLYENYGLFKFEPDQDLIESPEQVRCASSAGLSRIAVYIPYARSVKIHADLREYKCVLHLLDRRNIASPELLWENGATTLPMSGYNTDALFIAERRQPIKDQP
jgi:hypothetical protein